jgi:hypothetical protein
VLVRVLSVVTTSCDEVETDVILSVFWTLVGLTLLVVFVLV